MLRAVSRVSLCLWCICLMAALGWQSSPPRWFGDSISLGDLITLLERAGAGEVARTAAVDAAHAQYEQAWRTLRSGIVGRFELANADVSRSMVGVDVERLRSIVPQWEAICTSRDRIESALFDAVQRAANAGERDAVASARAARRRVVLGADVQIDPPTLTRLVDFHEILWTLPTLNWGAQDSAVRQACRAEIHKSEGKLGWFEGRSRAFGEGVLQYAGDPRNKPLPDDAREDEARVREWMNGRRAAFEEAFDGVSRQEAKILQDSSRLLAAVEVAIKSLPISVQIGMRDGYLQVAHPAVRTAHSLGVQGCAARAIRAKSLSDSSRATIRRLLVDWFVQDRRLMDALMTMDISLQTPARYVLIPDGSRLQPEMDPRWQALEDRRTTAAQIVTNQMQGMLSNAERGAFDVALAPEQDVFFLSPDVVSLDAAADKASEAVAKAATRPTMPEPEGRDVARVPIVRPMGSEWISCIAAALQADAASSEVLETLHRDYVGEWEHRLKERVRTLEDATRAEVMRSEEEVEQRMEDARLLALEQRALDEGLLTDASVTLLKRGDEPIVELMRIARLCGEPQWGIDAVFDRQSGGEENCNVPLIVLSVGLDHDVLLRAAHVIESERVALETSAAKFAAVQERYWTWRMQAPILWQRGSQLTDPGRWGAMQRQLNAREEQLMAEGRAAAKAKAAAQRHALESVLLVIPVAARPVVEARFLRSAYPSAFSTTEAAAIAIRKALQLDGLTEGQRVALAVARDTFEEQRASLTARLLALLSEESVIKAEGMDAGSVAAALQERVLAIEQVTVKRDNACMQALDAVCKALSAAQLQQIDMKCAARPQE
ncbi:MAG: hypothetical protein ACKO4V_05910 [Planctomycetota bacterium]